MIFRTLAAVSLLMAFVQAPAAAGAQAPDNTPVPQQNSQPVRTAPRTATPLNTPAQPYSSRPSASQTRTYIPETPASSAQPPQPVHRYATPQQPAQPAAQQPSQQPAAPNDANCATGNCDEWPASVKVANPDPAPPVWSLHDKILWAALLVLVILAYVAIMLALSTLKKIERQSRAGEEAATAAAQSAHAALMHAEAIVKSERPWILIAVEASPGVANGFTVTASNRGRTPARIVAMPHRIEFAEDESRLPEVPQYQQATTDAPFVPIILLPGEFAQITAFCRDDVKELCASEEQFARVENWEEKIFLYGRVTYRDLLSPQDEQTHQSAWCFWYIHGHQNSGMVPAGPPNYNMHT
jgi:hypothetical protein